MTATHDHSPPRGEGMPRAFSSAAMARRDVWPAALISATTGATRAACAPALPRKAAVAFARSASVSSWPLNPPSFAPRALAAASAAFVLV